MTRARASGTQFPTPSVGVDRYEGLPVAVTGGAGFIGHHLVAALTELGARVLVIDDLTTGDADRLPASVELERLDIASADLAIPFGRWRPVATFHLAAQASVPRGEAAPDEDLRVNGLGTLRVVEAARGAGVRRLVFTSSGGAIYGERRSAATERARARPESVYGIHKVLAERYVAGSGMPFGIARPSNVYGPGQDASGEGAVVAVFASAALENRPLVVHGDGNQTRDFLYVADLVDALLRIEATGSDGTWNVSAGRSTTILELAQIVEHVVGHPLERMTAPRRPADVRNSRIANASLRALGWSPRIGLETGIREIIRTRS